MGNGTVAVFNIKTQCSVTLDKVTMKTNGSALYPQGMPPQSR